MPLRQHWILPDEWKCLTSRYVMIRIIRLTALQLAICAMMLRALIPAGWMPNADSDATAGLFTICSVDSRASHDGSGSDDQKQVDRHEVCPFAAAPQLATPTVMAALAIPSLIAVVAEPSSVGDAVPRHTAYAPQAPRAPPAPATI